MSTAQLAAKHQRVIDRWYSRATIAQRIEYMNERAILKQRDRLRADAAMAHNRETR